MREPLPLPPMTVDEYLAFEERSPERHEYVEGHVYAMSGAMLRHGAIIRNIVVGLHPRVRSARCHLFFEGVKVRIGDERIYYPDVVVACGPQRMDSYFVAEPCLIVEVISPSSERTDRTEKKDAYARIPSVRAYAVVEQARRMATLFRRERAGEGWRPSVITDTQGDGRLVLPCPAGTVLTLDAVYDGLDVPAAPALRVREEVLEG